MPSSFNPPGAGGGGSPSGPEWTYVPGGSLTPATGTFTYDSGTQILTFNETAKDGSTGWFGIISFPISFLGQSAFVLSSATGKSGLFQIYSYSTDTYGSFSGEMSVDPGTLSGDYSIQLWSQDPGLKGVLAVGNSAFNSSITDLLDPSGAQDADTKAARDAAIAAAIAAFAADPASLATLIASAGITPATGVPTNATAGIVDAAT